MRGLWTVVAVLLLSATAEAASLLPNGEQTFVDQNGQPYSAGKVYFYIPTTTTPKTTWQDAGQTVPNSNPVVLDAAGRAIIYGSGSYRQVLKDQYGNTIWDQLTLGFGSGQLVINTAITGSTTIGGCAGVYPILNGASAPITITMPTGPSDGDTCEFIDVGNNLGSYPATFVFGAKTLANGSNSWVMNANQESVGFSWLETTNVWAAN